MAETPLHTHATASAPALQEAVASCPDVHLGARNLAPLTRVSYAPDLGHPSRYLTERRTRVDWAHAIRDLVDVRFPDAERIVLVLDNLNTHDPASLYLAFPPAEAKRLWDKLELHVTPKHGSWLTIAEIELSALGRRCLDRRLPDRDALAAEVAAWTAARNAAAAAVDWQFTTADARTTLKHLDPVLQPAARPCTEH